MALSSSAAEARMRAAASGAAAPPARRRRSTAAAEDRLTAASCRELPALSHPISVLLTAASPSCSAASSPCRERRGAVALHPRACGVG